MSTEEQLQELHASLSTLDLASALRRAAMLAALRKDWLHYHVFEMHLIFAQEAPPLLSPTGPTVDPKLGRLVADLTVADRTFKTDGVMAMPADELARMAAVGKRTFESGMALPVETLKFLFDVLRVETQIKNRISSFIIRALTQAAPPNANSLPEQPTNSMTGLPNLERFSIDLEQLFAANFALPIIHAFIDIDNLKQINTEIGHDEADKVIIAVAHSMLSTLLDRGQLYHRSGDEFLVLLRNHSTEEARLLFERVRKAVEALKLPKNVSTTISIGVATHSVHISSADELRKAANQANQQAKRRGKNQIYVVGDT